jgi:hypothetical protein
MSDELTGPWAADCIGRLGAPAAYYTYGTWVPTTCGETPLSVAESRQAFGVGPTLAGVE